jgi:hypothetical protein
MALILYLLFIDDFSGKIVADTGAIVTGEDIMAQFDTTADEDVIF